jgi:3-isopropylmalate/(R)-2-methylmalate dehydratase small subunit
MEAIKQIVSQTVVLPQADIDTDQIIPARYLTTTSRQGISDGLFYDWRYKSDGSLNPEFPLNQEGFRDAKVLVAGDNFGCGSSREHAPWALKDYGIDAVISTRFADIFRSNSLKNGLLPIVVDADSHRWLLEHPGARISVDVGAATLSAENGPSLSFDIEPFAQYCLVHGTDQLGYLLGHLDKVVEFEKGRA